MAIRKDQQEYRFKIEAYSPSTMPLGRLTEYLKDLVTVFGEDVHLIRVDDGSTMPVMLADPENVPKIDYRLQEVERQTAPANVMQAVRRINRKLRMDAASASLINPTGDNVIYFPGAEADALEYGPFNEVGTLDGVPVVIGGINDPVPIHLEGRKGEQYNCEASRTVAREIAKCLFTTIIRAEGVGRWLRNVEGDWELLHFKIVRFDPLALVSEVSLRNTIDDLRKIPAKWKALDDPIGTLTRIRDDVEM